MSDISQRIANLSPEQRALLEKRVRAGAGRSAAAAPIAIIGVGCRLPGGVSGASEYWQLLARGVDAISEVPRDRWDNSRLYDPDPDVAGRISSRWGGFLQGVDGFDAAYFGISPREATRMDPQQRVLLEVAVEALEDAGIPLERLAGSDTGVFVGAHGHASDYLWLQYADPGSMDAFTGTGTAHNLFAGRLSYVFDAHGPALVIDTACSSSLAAVHLAVQSLRSGESTMAIAAGVNLILGPHFSIAASRMHMLAPDGRCKAFDQRADGFVRSEGCGVVVLKRLTDALADGDPIRAVIRGTAMNQDGHTNGITAPNGIAQRAVIERALRDAGVEGRSIGYIEAHGTGTALGDPIEIEALALTVGQGEATSPRCHVGSVKTNIGHLEGAAGIAGLIKAVLVLQHRQVPRNLHFTGLNPHISLAGTRFSFPATLEDWADGPQPRLAGVSSFGWSGTNVHLVLEEAPRAADAPPSVATSSEAAPRLLTLSARSPGALQAMLSSYRQRIAASSESELREVCYTAAMHRSHHDHRLALVARSGGEMALRLDEASIAEGPRRITERPRVVFVFPGQGSQWLGMGRSLLRHEPAFRAAIEQCDAAIRGEAGWSLLQVLEGEAPGDDIGVLQPTLFAVQVSLAVLWRSWGIVPEAVVGHSMGEVAAAHVAGILDLADATRVICRRSALLRRIAGRGAMALVELPMSDARAACLAHADRVAVAVSNGPRSSVLSGDPVALDSIVASLTSRNVFCRLVKVDVASHSPQVDELRADLLQALTGIAPRDAQVPLYSTVDVAKLGGRECGPEYWVRNLREPVRFFDTVRQLLGDGFDAFVEISPHPILLPAVDDAIAEASAEAIGVASLRRDQDETHELFIGLARLYARGADVDWPRLWPQRQRVVSLPAYPWQHERFWVEDARPAADTTWLARASTQEAGEDTREWLFAPIWRAAPRAERRAAMDPGAWLVFADRGGRGAELAALLTRSGRDVWCVNAAGAFAETGAKAFDARAGEPGDVAAIVGMLGARGVSLAGIVHLWNLDAPANDAEVAEIEQFQVAGCASVAFLVQALVALELEHPPRIRIVTQGAQSPDGRGIVLAQTPAWGLGRVIAEEHPEFWGGLLDLDPASSIAAAAAFIVQELGEAEIEDGVAQSASGRHVLRLAPFTPAPGPEVRCDPAASYLVTGGLGAVGLETARWLVERGARHLLLVGRSEVPSPERRATPAAATWTARLAAIRQLEASGAVIEPVSLDITDESAISRFLDERRAAGRPPIRGVVHAAADTGDCLVIELDIPKLMKVLRPKLVGASLIERATRHMPLDFLILHSSLGSLLGQPGHPSYAAANAFLDGLALDVAQQGRRALAVNWAAWADLGLAQTEGGRRTIGELERRGIRSFSAAAGTEALGRLLDGGALTAVVAPSDWTRFVEASRKTRVPSIVRDIGQYEPATATPDRTVARKSLDAAPAADRLQTLIGLLKMELAEVLRLPPTRIEADVPMGNFGLESLTALELRKRLEALLGARLSATVMWNYPTITLLAGYLLSRLFGGDAATAAGPAAPEPAAPASVATTELSEEDAIQALMGRGGSGT